MAFSLAFSLCLSSSRVFTVLVDNFVFFIMVLFRNVLVLGLASSGLAFPSFGVRDVLKMTIAEKLSEPPTGWVKDSQKVDKDAAMMTLRIHLKQQDMDKFHDLATKVVFALPCHYP